MDAQPPIATDNIYKFYALFGLLLFVFSIGGIIHITRATNEFLLGSMVEYESLKAIEHPSQAERSRIAELDKRLEIAVQDKSTLTYGLMIVEGVGLLGMLFGFWTWHRKIQPLQDETARLLLEKLKHEVRIMARD